MTDEAVTVKAITFDNDSSYIIAGAGSVNVEADKLQSATLVNGYPLPKIIAFISDKKSSGRSVAAINYAETLALGAGRTLLIDLDWTGVYLSEHSNPVPARRLGQTTLGRSAHRTIPT